MAQEAMRFTATWTQANEDIEILYIIQENPLQQLDSRISPSKQVANEKFICLQIAIHNKTARSNISSLFFAILLLLARVSG